MEILIVLDQGYGKKVNSTYKQWNRIKSQAQHTIWSKRVAKLFFGTYKTISILEVIENFEANFPNDIIKNSFISEIKEAYKKYSL